MEIRSEDKECGTRVTCIPYLNFSVLLTFADILRNTPKNSADFCNLEIAIQEIQNVMTYINEDKKRTEGQVALFDIFNEIDKCPVSWSVQC